MSRKRKRKNKHHKQPKVPKALTVPKAPEVPQIVSPAKRDTPSWSQSRFITVAGLVLAVLSLVISLVALIALRPHLSASASPPSDSNDLLDSRFTASNDGYLKVTNVRAICYVSTSVFPPGPALTSFVSGVIQANLSETLGPADGFTVPCTDPHVHIPSQSADLTIVVYYRPWPFTFVHSRRFFRFVSRRTADNSVAWDRQASLPIETEFDKSLALDSYLKAYLESEDRCPDGKTPCVGRSENKRP
jgi:hypothetical protein